MSNVAGAGSIIAPSYATGDYFATHADPDQDAGFKAEAFLKLFLPFAKRNNIEIESYVDVGCGGGGTASHVARGLRRDQHPLTEAIGCDIFEGVEKLRPEGVVCMRQDFCDSELEPDLATLFDVIEHVPDPVGFLRQTAAKSSVVALHIPLDNSWVNCFFDRFRNRLRYPGHLLLLDTANAINLLSMSGVLAVDYVYTHGYDAPSGGMTRVQRMFRPIRRMIARISPWLASRTIGGVSLMIIGITPRGMKRWKHTA